MVKKRKTSQDKVTKTPQSQIEASGRYLAKAYDRINLAVHKGDREKYRQFADAHGMSLNKLFITAVDKYIELSDNSENNIADSD